MWIYTLYGQANKVQVEHKWVDLDVQYLTSSLWENDENLDWIQNGTGLVKQFMTDCPRFETHHSWQQTKQS